MLGYYKEVLGGADSHIKSNFVCRAVRLLLFRDVQIMYKQERRSTCDVTFGCVRATTVAVEQQ
jgi:hypothetical protein